MPEIKWEVRQLKPNVWTVGYYSSGNRWNPGYDCKSQKEADNLAEKWNMEENDA
jgi:hypothetical protein